MKLLAFLLGIAMLVWSVDLATDLFLGAHTPWMQIAGIAIGGIGWLSASLYKSELAKKGKVLRDSMFNGLSRLAGDTMFAPTQMAPDALKRDTR